MHRPVLRLAVALVLFVCGAARAAPDAVAWPFWAVHDPASSARVDHAPLGRLLQRYLARDREGVQRMRYAQFTGADRQALRNYIDDLAAVPVRRLARPEQFAYWINLYNALTLALVLAHYPVDDIRSIGGGLFSFAGPWGMTLVEVEGQALTLDDIEHRILRPLWGDPRIHYAVNCASIGCPDLQPEPYTRDNTERLLEQAARDYVNSPRGVRFTGGRLIVSRLYSWYVEDFGGDAAGVLAHLRRHAAAALAQRLAARSRIDAYAYDWRLNDARTANLP